MHPSIRITLDDAIDAAVAVCVSFDWDIRMVGPVAGHLWHWRRALMGEAS